jgi:hypothetical protein
MPAVKVFLLQGYQKTIAEIRQRIKREEKNFDGKELIRILRQAEKEIDRLLTTIH